MIDSLRKSYEADQRINVGANVRLAYLQLTFRLGIFQLNADNAYCYMEMNFSCNYIRGKYCQNTVYVLTADFMAVLFSCISNFDLWIIILKFPRLLVYFLGTEH